jgi:group I intron endonuclease
MNLQDKDQFPKLSGIYKITNSLNNKCYIGSAVNIKVRLHRHLYELNKQIHRNKYLQKSFNKNGSKVFDVEILELFEKIDYQELLNIEKTYILYFNSINKGYNLMLDNSSFFKNLNKSEKHIEENIKRNSKSVCAINIETNELEYIFNSVTDASKFFDTSSSNISRVCKNKLNYIKGYNFCYSEEYSENKDYKKPINAMKGRKASENHRMQLQKAIWKNKGKKVYQYNIDKIFIKEYPAMAVAERENNLKKESLRNKIDKETPFEGFYWLSTKL